MDREYCYVAKCLAMKLPRVYGHSRQDCEEAMEKWTAKQCRFKPLALYKYPLIHKGGSEYHIDWGYEVSEGKYVDNGEEVFND